MKKALILALILIVSGVLVVDTAYANEAPIWHDIPTQAGFVDKRISFSVHAYDSDGDELTYRASNLPSRSNFNPKTKVFSWTPVNSGNYNITFRVYDGFTWVDASARIVVRDLNQSSRFIDDDGNTDDDSVGPPTFVSFNPPLVATEGLEYTYTVQAAGSIGARVSYRLASSPQGMIIDSQSGVIRWTPNFNQGRDEPYNVKVGISNAQYENQREFKLFVQDVNQAAPIVSPPPTRKVTPPSFVDNSNTKVAFSISDLEVRQDGNDIVITWKTNLASVGRVIYDRESQESKKTDFNYSEATPNSESQKDHEVRIDGGDLDRGETYYFRAVAKRNGNTIVSDEMKFEVGQEGLALLASLGEFFTNPWLWVIIVIIILWLIFRKIFKK